MIERIKNRISHATKARIQYRKYKQIYGSSTPNPYSVIWIDPREIRHIVTPRHLFRHDPNGYYILGGEWDQTERDQNLMFVSEFEAKTSDPVSIPIDNYEFHNSVKKYISTDMDWQSTNLCQWAESCSTLPKNKKRSIMTRNQKIDRICGSIKRDGYQLQKELRSDVHKWITNAVFPPEIHEIMVCIGRNGKFIFEDGKHRFAVADALGLEKMPVRIFVRHLYWQQKRCEMSNADSLEEVREELLQFVDHPDMQDVIP